MTVEYLKQRLESVRAQKANALAVYHQTAGSEQTLLHLIEQATKPPAASDNGADSAG